MASLANMPPLASQRIRPIGHKNKQCLQKLRERQKVAFWLAVQIEINCIAV